MRKILLDLDLLRTLVVGIDTGSFAQAAERIGRSQSAISLQMKKLEEMLEVEVFEKQGRSLALTATGRTLYDYAQRMLELNEQAVDAVRREAVSGNVRFGMSVDFEHTWLPATLARFSRSHPKVAIEIGMDRNSVLAAQVARGELDIALLFANDKKPTDTGAARLGMAWIGRRDLAPREGEPLPLLLLEHPCVFRLAALKALDDAGIAWRIAVTGPSLGGLWAAAQAGIGITLRSDVSIPPGLADVGAALGLPKLPSIDLCLSQGEKALTPAAARLKEVILEVLADSLLANLQTPQRGAT